MQMVNLSAFCGGISRQIMEKSEKVWQKCRGVSAAVRKVLFPAANHRCGVCCGFRTRLQHPHAWDGASFCTAGTDLNAMEGGKNRYGEVV